MKGQYLDTIVTICQNIRKQGSSPSVGLIKSKLTQKVPLPEIIAGLKYWQANPDAIPQARKYLNTTSQDESFRPTPLDWQLMQERVSTLEDMLTTLQAEVLALKQQ